MNLKFIASVAGAVGLGASVAWAVTADRADHKIQKLSEENLKMQDSLREKTRENIDLRYELNDKLEEIENLQSAIDVETGFSEEESEIDSENSPGEASVEINSGGEIEEVKLDDHQEPTDEEIEESRAHLQRLIAGFIPTPEAENFRVEERPVVATTKYDPPFVISQHEFAYPQEEGDDYAKITLRYFPKQQVLLDEDEDPIDDVEAYVGWRSLNRFGDESGNPDVVYVRNRRMETDFEVERETDEDLPLHVKYAMPKMEFVSREKAGTLQVRRAREEDG